MLRLERTAPDLGTDANAEGGYIALYVLDEPDLRNFEMGRISWRGDNAGNDEIAGRLGFWTSNYKGVLREQMTIDKHGNVGIGTGTPGAKLDVAGTTRTDILTIDGGSDIAEPFDIKGDGFVRPGMIVAIDPEQIGKLRIADTPYDVAVAGIISGANGINSGLVLRQEGSVADGKHPVALTGRVWCLCDADANGPIKAGNMLTTSGTPGHAMKAADRSRAYGATIGKAMSSLDSGKGLVLVLVSLQ